jgi:DNA-binding MarR family transcriptional regulator
MDRVEDCISFLMGKAMQQITKQAREKLAPFGVTPPQYAVLKVLWEHDGTSGAEITARLRIDSATITGLIDRLEDAKLLERRGDRQDRRVHRLYLTPRGHALQDPLDDVMTGFNRDASDFMGPDAEAVMHWLGRVGNVSR